ncbi:MAG: hypothetical protein D4R43_03180 [Sphingobacteriales bacterium]|nr:MAG: hypothetical protein D4R43_03180 [Sphingobacteriales bacterium]GDX53034.1 hypothetical protein LBMAG27_20810 [Bacteroidota bacterium]
MRKITKEEAEKFVTQRASTTPIRSAAEGLKPGEILLIELNDWQQKKGPYYMLKKIEKLFGYKYDCKKISSGDGWIVERVS